MHTGFVSIHPAVSILYYIAILTLCILCMHPISLIILFLGISAYNFQLLGFRKSIKNMKYFIFISLLIIILNPLVNQRGNTILFYLFSRRITLESLTYGIMRAFSLINIIWLFTSFNVIIDNHKFIYIFGKFFKKTAFLITMTLRYIPMLKQRAQEINLIHSRNINTTSKYKFINKIKNSMNILSILVTWSLENAVVTAQSMTSRGYGLKKRTSYTKYIFNYVDISFLIIEIILFVYIIYNRFNETLYLTVYPHMSTITLNSELIFANAAILLIVFMPFLFDRKEYYKWHYMK